MAIEKRKKAQKTLKQKSAKNIAVAPDLEDKRKAFQDTLSGKKPLETPPPIKQRRVSRGAIAFAVSIVFVLLAGAGATWAYAWYQSPEKIVMDSLSNALASKSATYEGNVYLLDNPEPQISYSGALKYGLSKFDVAISMPQEGALSSINASTIQSSDAVYLKIDKASQLISETAPPAIKQSFQPYIPLIRDQVDGKWMKVSSNDINLYEPVTHVSQCAADIFQTFTTDDTASSRFRDMYMQYPFFKIVEVSQPADSVGRYNLTLEAARYNQFKERLYASELYASFAACNKKTHDISDKDLQNLTVELSIAKSNRQLLGIKAVQGKAIISQFTLTPTLDAPVTIEVPQNVARISDIQVQAFRDTVKNTFKNFQ